MSVKVFKGAGGGDSGPVTHADSLRSDDFVEIICGLCQGPIKGLATGNTDYFIGSTQFQNDSGAPNFPGMTLINTPGSVLGEEIIPVLGGIQSQRNVGPLGLLYEQIYTFTTSSDNLDAVILTFNITRLFQSGNSALLQQIPGTDPFSTYLPSSLTLAINVQDASGTFQNPFPTNVVLFGQTTSGEPAEVLVPFTPGSTGPYLVAVQMLTQTTNSAPAYINWTGYVEVNQGQTGFVRSDAVQQQLFSGVPVIRTTQQAPQNPNGTYGINFISVRIDVNQLVRQNSSGVFPATVIVRILYKQTSNTEWIHVYGHDIWITGVDTTSIDVQQFAFAVPMVNDTYDVQVINVSAPEYQVLVNIAWESMEEIIAGPMTFPGVACAHLFGEASQTLTSIPSVWGIYDLLIVNLPTNYNPYTREYTGTWDGTFQQDWTNNPAWCLYDLATNSTYGCAAYWPDISVDIYDAYSAGQWCDALVPDGAGGLQPRYTMNTLIQEPRGGREQLRYMAGVFNASLVDDLAGNLRIIVDQPQVATAIFTQENVYDDGSGPFAYTYTDIGNRYNYITVSFNDPDINYQVNTRVIWDQDHINRFGKIPLQFAAIGCTDPHEAVRRAAFKLISATTETEIVSFKTNRQGLTLAGLRPVLVSDPDMGNGLTGRIQELSSDRTTIFLRDPIYLEVGVQYIFNTHMPDPNYPATSDTPLTIVSIPFYAPDNGANLAFQLQGALPGGVDPQAQFSISCTGNEVGVPKSYRVTKAEELEGNPDMFSVEAIEINPSKWILSDNATDVAGLSFINFPTNLAPPTGIEVQTTVFEFNNQSVANVAVTWIASVDPRTTNYNIQYRISNTSNWTTINGSSSTRCDLYNIPSGAFDFQVQAVGIGGIVSIWATLYGQQAGQNVPPDDVQNLQLSVTGTNINLIWTPVFAANLAYYWLRFNPNQGSSVTWENSSDLNVSILATNCQVPAVPGTYLIKAVNTQGTPSVDAAEVNTSGTEYLPYVVLEQVEQFPAWAGGGIPGTGAGPLGLNSLQVDGYGFLVPVITEGDSAASGYYCWGSEDFGVITSFNIAISVAASVANVTDPLSTWPTLSAVPELSSARSSDWSTGLSISISTDGATFPTFIPFVPGNYIGRAFRFQLRLSQEVLTVSPYVSECRAIISVVNKGTSGQNLTCSASGQTVAFLYPFALPPLVLISNKMGQAGDYYNITDETNVGFTITFYNYAGTAVSRVIDWTAEGV